MNAKIFLIIGTFVLAVSSGCATKQSTFSQIKVETKSTGGVSILSAKILRDGNRTKVIGLVQRDGGYYGTIYRHLDLAVIDNKGYIISRQAANFFPNPILFSPNHNPSRSYYVFNLNGSLPSQSHIRLTVDQTRLAECGLLKDRN